jgi:acyl-CoA synthetase (AMP-forming)/AMP-acid ligase II/acyl carrier protein
MPDSLSTTLARWAETRRDAPAIVFLPDGEDESVRMTWGELMRAARRVGAALSRHAAPGDRVVLLHPASIDFAVSILACMMSGGVAVPVAPGRRRQTSEAVVAILRDADPSVVATTAALAEPTERAIEASGVTPPPIVVVIDDLVAPPTGDLDTDWRPYPVGDDDLALLQYTSGSTGTPKGVALTHGNLLANREMMRQAFALEACETGVSWLPQYHDMGLIGDTLQILSMGMPRVFMPSRAFIERPIRWLRAVARHPNVLSGGPDFAYDHCVRRVTDEQCDGLDLSSWRVAFSGSEPVRAETLDRFCERFAPYGFRREAFLPCFGMAEASLFVTGGPGPGRRVDVTLDAEALAAGRVAPAEAGKRLVGCGAVARDTTLRIVDPKTKTPAGPDAVGELWVASPSISRGYWRRPDATALAFGARLPGDDAAYLRTGDLGFLHEEQLVIVGRMSDTIIIRGRNLHPQDVERTVQHAHPTLERHAGAAFPVERDGAEAMVVVQELRRVDRRTADHAAIRSAVRRAISREHGVAIAELVLVRPGTVLKTTSGKIRRRQMRQRYLDGAIEAITPVAAPAAPAAATDVDELLAWLRDYADRRLDSRLMDERKCVPPYVVLDLGNRGLLGLRGPRDQGGLGLGHRDTLRVFEQLGAIDQSLALFVGIHNVLGTGPIARHATETTRTALEPSLVSGRELAAFALTEPGAGSNPRAIRTRAVPCGPGRWRLHGTKYWSGIAAWAGVINVFARLEGPDGAGLGMAAFAVRQGAAGLRHGVEAPTMGMRALVQNTVHLDGVEVGEVDMLGRPGDGLRVAQEAMMEGRLAIASACLGGMRRCAQLMHRYASRRSVGGERLAHNPVTLERFGAITASITALEALMDRLGTMLDAGARIPDEVYAAVKIIAPELLWRSADGLVQVLGGRGYVETNIAPQMLRDARVLRIFEGPTEAMGAFLGARVASDGAIVPEFIDRDLKAPETAAVLRDLLARLRAPLHEADLAIRVLLRYRLGVAAAHAVLAGALEAGGEEPSRGRALGRLHERIRATAPPTSVVDRDAVARTIGSYADRIGDLEPSSVGEDTALDPLLRRADPVAGDEDDGGPEIDEDASRGAATDAASVESSIRTPAEIQAFLCAWLAERLELRPEDVDPHVAFADLGADSVTAVELVMDLGVFVGQTLDETLPWEAPSIAVVAQRLGGTPGAAPSAAPPGGGPAAAAELDDADLAAIEVSLQKLGQRLGGS